MGANEFSREETLLVGQLLVESNPALAITLLSAYVPPPKFEIENIYRLYTKFCEANNLDKQDMCTPYKHIFYKRIFAGAIVFVYDPEAFKHKRRIREGLVKGVRGALNQRWPSYVSKLVREASVRMRVYDDYREKMEETIKLFINESRIDKVGAKARRRGTVKAESTQPENKNRSRRKTA